MEDMMTGLRRRSGALFPHRPSVVFTMLTAAKVAEDYFLESRHMLLEIAAHFDRYDAAAARETGGTGQGGAAKMARLREALAILAAPRADHERTVALLELFAHD
jgi:hypothetical protein